jgi:uncharacterized protein (TIGR02266 family)
VPETERPSSASEHLDLQEEQASTLERELEQEATGVLQQTRWLERRFDAVQRGLRILEEHGQLHPDLAEVEARLELRMPIPPSVEVYRQEVQTARQQALIIRGRVHKRMRTSVDSAANNLELVQTHLGRLELLVQTMVARVEGRPDPQQVTDPELPPDWTPPGRTPRTRPPPLRVESQASQQLSLEEIDALRVESTAALLPEPAPVAQETAASERRYEHRVPLQAEVDWSSESNFYSGFSTNLSEGGLFVATVKLLPIGTEVDLNITLPGEGALQLHGVVRWARVVNIDTPDVYPGIGIQFVDLTPEISAKLRRFLAQREPMFYPD